MLNREIHDCSFAKFLKGGVIYRFYLCRYCNCCFFLAHSSISLAKVRRTFDTPISTRFEDTYALRRGSVDSSRRAFESPVRPYESVRTYEAPKRYDKPLSLYETPKPYETTKPFENVYALRRGSVDSSRRAYESPICPYESVRSFESPSRYDRPRSLYDTPKAYETAKPYESPKYTYESPKYSYESPKYGYESPKTSYEPKFKFDSPSRQLEKPRKTYEIPRGYSVENEDIVPLTLKIPKIPYERPSLINKRDDSVKLTWLPAPLYDLPEDARRVSYIVESREVPSQAWNKLATGIPSTTYIAKHLRPDKEYEFRVRAQNQHGISEPTWNATLDRRFG